MKYRIEYAKTEKILFKGSLLKIKSIFDIVHENYKDFENRNYERPNKIVMSPKSYHEIRMKTNEYGILDETVNSLGILMGMDVFISPWISDDSVCIMKVTDKGYVL